MVAAVGYAGFLQHARGHGKNLVLFEQSCFRLSVESNLCVGYMNMISLKLIR